MSDNNFIDNSNETLKYFTKNLELSKEDISELDIFVKDINKTIKDTNVNIDEKLIVNIGKAFKYLIEEGVTKNDDKRNS
jgi:hypothetical protein